MKHLILAATPLIGETGCNPGMPKHSLNPLSFPKRPPRVSCQVVVHLRTSFQHPPLRFFEYALRKDLIRPFLTSRRLPDNGRILPIDVLSIHSDIPPLHRLRIIVAAVINSRSIQAGSRAYRRVDIFVGVFEGFGASFSSTTVDAEVVPRGPGGAAGNGVDGGYGVVDLTCEST